eukprot:5591012-Pleurochrysis_carterae.AAC.1
MRLQILEQREGARTCVARVHLPVGVRAREREPRRVCLTGGCACGRAAIRRRLRLSTRSGELPKTSSKAVMRERRRSLRRRIVAKAASTRSHAGCRASFPPPVVRDRHSLRQGRDV